MYLQYTSVNGSSLYPYTISSGVETYTIPHPVVSGQADYVGQQYEVYLYIPGAKYTTDSTSNTEAGIAIWEACAAKKTTVTIKLTESKSYKLYVF